MDDLVVARVMSSPVYEVTPETSVSAAGERMLEADIGSLVVEDGGPTGIVTSSDFVRLVADGGSPETPVEAVMSTELVTVDAQTHITVVAELMSRQGVHHVPVVGDDAVIGMVASSDVARYVSSVPTIPSE